MAHLMRAAKSASRWTAHDLLAFNIAIQDVDSATFFGTPHLPATTVSPVVLNNVTRPRPPAVITDDERLFFAHLKYLNTEKSSPHDFTRHLLSMLRFDHNERLLTMRESMTFTMCGARVRAKADVAVYMMEASNVEYLLMVKAAKTNIAAKEPVPQMIAQTIAAFVENNRPRQHPLLEQIILAITMAGPCPIFYKVPVTQDLVSSLSTGKYPSQSIIVQRLVPPVVDKAAYMIHGMNPLPDRRIVFQCLEAMRALLDG
ncbi:hypothetical protein BDP27DRAFT_1424194 [Rhodocollybia butyracea]|uniref:Uncharacterized protein n=1 Tax=Rhodocollybia butyracea TaxID=206335 RepID=A0A9P5PP72_9AGAR|nr:hypothetical protein BDP27DRAFT_1424194 [Rhodocollybia butyracea]